VAGNVCSVTHSPSYLAAVPEPYDTVAIEQLLTVAAASCQDLQQDVRPWQWIGGCSSSKRPVPTLPSGSEFERSLRTLRGVGMIFLWTILMVLIWIAIAFWPARVAGRKGHSFIGYFIFSLFFFPAALIVAYLVSPRVAAIG
jgi:hypothetical protein